MSDVRLSETPLRNPESINLIDINTLFLSPRMWDQEEKDIITVIKKANNLSFFSNKRRSMTE